MRSRDPIACRPRLLVLTLLVSMGMSGCQVGRTFFQMDSNAPVPFMGVDLLPKRNRTSPTEGVSRFQDEQIHSTMEAAPMANSQVAPPSRLTRLLGRSASPKALALPTTDRSENGAMSPDAPVEAFR